MCPWSPQGSCGRAEDESGLKEGNPCWVQERKARSRRAGGAGGAGGAGNSAGVPHTCARPTHVLAPQALPHQLKTRERGTMALSVCARSHPPTRGSRRPTCVCLQPRVTGCALWVRGRGGACLLHGCGTSVRSGHTRVHTHTSVRACLSTRGPCVGGQRACGLACAVPRHRQMVPCLHVTSWGPKPAPCGGDTGRTGIALCGVMTLPGAGPWVLGRAPTTPREG